MRSLLEKPSMQFLEMFFEKFKGKFLEKWLYNILGGLSDFYFEQFVYIFVEVFLRKCFQKFFHELIHQESIWNFPKILPDIAPRILSKYLRISWIFKGIRYIFFKSFKDSCINFSLDSFWSFFGNFFRNTSRGFLIV